MRTIVLAHCALINRIPLWKIHYVIFVTTMHLGLIIDTFTVVWLPNQPVCFVKIKVTNGAIEPCFYTLRTDVATQPHFHTLRTDVATQPHFYTLRTNGATQPCFYILGTDVATQPHFHTLRTDGATQPHFILQQGKKYLLKMCHKYLRGIY